MRGTSALSQTEVVRDAQDRFRTADGSLEPVAADLFGMADAIDSSNQLVRLLSDVGREAALKESTVQELFGGRVGDLALEVGRDVVRHRWSEQEDILDALEDVGVVALLEQARRDGELESVEEQLFQFSRAIDASPALSEAFDDARERPEERRAIVRSLLQGRAHRLTEQLAVQAVGRRSEDKPSRRVLRFAQIASDQRRRLLAIVTSARPLSEQQSARLGAILARVYGREVQMNLETSPEVVGGMRIQVGDDLFDATVLARLADARSLLAS